jgi:hypothetical protein
MNWSVLRLPPSDGFIQVPKSWNNQKFQEKVFPDLGYGTYVLKLNHVQDVDLYFKTSTISTAYAVYMKDTQIFRCGNIGKDRY